MPQAFDYFVCSPSAMKQWVSAVQRRDEELQDSVESEMLSVTSLKGIGHDDVAILSRCFEGAVPNTEDMSNAVDAARLVDVVNQSNGPWVLELNPEVVSAIWPFSIRRSWTASKSLAGSMTRPF